MVVGPQHGLDHVAQRELPAERLPNVALRRELLQKAHHLAELVEAVLAGHGGDGGAAGRLLRREVHVAVVDVGLRAAPGANPDAVVGVLHEGEQRVVEKDDAAERPAEDLEVLLQVEGGHGLVALVVADAEGAGAHAAERLRGGADLAAVAVEAHGGRDHLAVGVEGVQYGVGVVPRPSRVERDGVVLGHRAQVLEELDHAGAEGDLHRGVHGEADDVRFLLPVQRQRRLQVVVLHNVDQVVEVVAGTVVHVHEGLIQVEHDEQLGHLRGLEGRGDFAGGGGGLEPGGRRPQALEERPELQVVADLGVADEVGAVAANDLRWDQRAGADGAARDEQPHGGVVELWRAVDVTRQQPHHALGRYGWLVSALGGNLVGLVRRFGVLIRVYSLAFGGWGERRSVAEVAALKAFGFVARVGKVQGVLVRHV
ncbi:chaperonin GroEL [Babesia caballi]|uniref:Chaperonin GroEL n=1 Tax=Babesia caballi TaxID=5871 RepID=A0AAV4LUD2_BABCB|nr:chaperonin GroEL [Babesia caballi]